LKTSDFKQGDPVVYVPHHAHGDLHHKDCEPGIVSSVNDSYVFVKYFPQLYRFGWEGTTSKATSASDLTYCGPEE